VAWINLAQSEDWWRAVNEFSNEPQDIIKGGEFLN
jgi:hypothetical protein